MKTPRIIKVGDALSQLVNVALLPNHHDTTANESICGRAHRMGWKRTERTLDWVFSPFEKDHCRNAYEADVQRARDLLSGGQPGTNAG